MRLRETPLVLIVAALAIVLAGVVVTSLLPQQGPPPDSAIQSVDEAVALGILDPDVLSELRGVGVSEAVVHLDTAAIIRQLDGNLGSEPVAERIAQLTGALQQHKQRLIGALGERATVVRDFPSLGAALVAFRDERALVTVLRNPLVLGVSADTPVVLPPEEPVDGAASLVPQATQFRGNDVYVGVLDTGIDTAMYPGRIADASIADTLEAAPNDGAADDFGHGTRVSSVVLSYAQEAQLLVADVFSWSEVEGERRIGAKPQHTLAGMQWLIELKRDQGFDVRAVNLSLGRGHHPPAICSAGYDFAAALYYDILPVVASGNSAFEDDDGKKTPGVYQPGMGHPACAQGALSVGAVTTAHCPDDPPDRVAEFSQSSELLGMLAAGKCAPTAGGLRNGTSYAAPAVAGAVAVLASADATAGADAIRAALVDTGVPITDPNSGITRNRLDVEQAVDYLLGRTEPVATRGPLGTLRAYSLSTTRVSAFEELAPGSAHVLSRVGVRNLGTAEGTYRFEVTAGDPGVPDWFHIIPSSITLAPDDQGFASPRIEVPGSANPGTYRAVIRVVPTEGGLAASGDEVHVAFTVGSGDSVSGGVLLVVVLLTAGAVALFLYRRRRDASAAEPHPGPG
jgi:hypothetical protein